MNLAQRIIIKTVKVYKKCISSRFPSKCKFIPVCSDYMVESIKEFGSLKGFCLGIKRVLRCNHFSKGGYDPVPVNINGEYKWLM